LSGPGYLQFSFLSVPRFFEKTPLSHWLLQVTELYRGTWETPNRERTFPADLRPFSSFPPRPEGLISGLPPPNPPSSLPQVNLFLTLNTETVGFPYTGGLFAQPSSGFFLDSQEPAVFPGMSRAAKESECHGSFPFFALRRTLTFFLVPLLPLSLPVIVVQRSDLCSLGRYPD